VRIVGAGQVGVESASPESLDLAWVNRGPPNTAMAQRMLVIPVLQRLKEIVTTGPILTGERARTLNRAGLIGLVAFALWYTAIWNIRRQVLTLGSLGDYGLNYEKSVAIGDQLAYPQIGFLYPPPNVVIRLALGQIGLEVSAIVWMVVLILCTLACFMTALAVLGLSNHPAKFMLAFLALLSVEYPFELDLRYLNGNVVYLILILGGLLAFRNARPHAAGVLLAASIAFKLYSLLFFFYFLLKRQYGLCLAMMLGIVGLFVLLPIAWFGVSPAWAITKSWLDAVAGTSSLQIPWEYPTVLLSFHKTLMTLLTAKGGKGVYNVLSLQEGAILPIVRCLQVAWLLFVGLYWWVSRRTENWSDSGTILLMDAGVLTLALLPLSPVLQSHHGVVLLLPAILLVSVVLDAEQARTIRLGALFFLLSGIVELQFGPFGPLRGLGMQMTMNLYMSALIFLRYMAGRGKLVPLDRWLESSYPGSSHGPDGNLPSGEGIEVSKR